MDFTALLKNLEYLWDIIYNTFSQIGEVLIMPLPEFYNYVMESLGEFIPEWWLDLIYWPFDWLIGALPSEITLAAFMLGGGLIFYIVYQLVTWIANLIT